MSVTSVLVNDTVRIKVKFIDIDPETGDQTEVAPDDVTVTILDSDENTVVNTTAVQVTSSTWYYDFTPTNPDTYTISFVGVIVGSADILVEQKLYVSSPTEDYKPTIVLGSEETITFAADISPLYIDPESLRPFFPDASNLEIAEIVYNYSLEIKDIFSLNDSEDGSGLSFNILEYIKAATACELSRTYGYGGDDEMSLHLGDFTVTNRTIPRNAVSRDNATSWCQIAAALRKEILGSKAGPLAFQPKGLPSGNKNVSSGKQIEADTGKVVYLSDRELYGPGRKVLQKDDPMPGRGLRSYD